MVFAFNRPLLSTLNNMPGWKHAAGQLLKLLHRQPHKLLHRQPLSSQHASYVDFIHYLMMGNELLPKRSLGKYQMLVIISGIYHV